MNIKTQGRIYAFDFLRILAACAVVMLHISADYVKTLDGYTWEFLLANCLNSLTRFAVPVFVMISGALMLDEHKAISSGKMLKTVLNMVLILFSWSVFYAVSYELIRPVLFHEEISLAAVVDIALNGHYHMWYLYLLIGLYAVTPILRFFIKVENAASVRFYLILSALVCFAVPFLNLILNHFLPGKDILASFVDNFKLGYFYEYLVYYVLGWYITHVGIRKSHRKFVYLAGVIGFAMTVIGTQIHAGTEGANYFYENYSLNIFAFGVAVFAGICYRFREKNITLGKTWLTLSGYTFGVYLIHCCFLFVFKKLTDGFHSVPLEIAVVFSASVTLSFLTVAVISRIPFLKKLVRG